MQSVRARRTAGYLRPAVLILLWAAPASAQIDAVVGLGGGVAAYKAVDDMADDSVGFALVYRLGKPEGFRPTFGLNWYSTDFDTVVAGQRVALGGLRLRPVMAGYGYWLQGERVALAATVVGGFSFNSFDTADALRIAYDRDLDELLLRVEASHSLAGRAEAGVWFDLTSRLGLMASVGYVAARPEITITTDESRESRRLRADAVKFQIGLVYGLF